MKSVGIISSGPELLKDPKQAQRKANSAIDVLAFQYESDNFVFNIPATIGVSLSAMEYCRLNNYKYSIVLSGDMENTATHWFSEQQDALRANIPAAHAITSCNSDTKGMYERLIDNSSFVVVFWAENKAGPIPEAIRYAFSCNKIVLDGLKDFRLITSGHLKKHKII